MYQIQSLAQFFLVCFVLTLRHTHTFFNFIRYANDFNSNTTMAHAAYLNGYTLPVSTTSKASEVMKELTDLNKIRTALYEKIAAKTDDSFLKTFFRRMATDSRRFRTELLPFVKSTGSTLSAKVITRVSDLWDQALVSLENNNLSEVMHVWNQLEEIIIESYLKLTTENHTSDAIRKVIDKQVDVMRKDRNVYRFVESIFFGA